MTWRSFVEFVTMRAMGQEDAVYRNYDTTYKPGKAGSDYLTYAISACERMKLHTQGVPLQFLIAEVQARLRGMGYYEPDTHKLECLMCEWYIWDALKYGSLRRWKYRKRENPLI